MQTVDAKTNLQLTDLKIGKNQHLTEVCLKQIYKEPLVNIIRFI